LIFTGAIPKAKVIGAGVVILTIERNPDTREAVAFIL
jgi:hypothetical protein